VIKFRIILSSLEIQFFLKWTFKEIVYKMVMAWVSFFFVLLGGELAIIHKKIIDKIIFFPSHGDK
jgi:hypothetical protein